MTHKLRNLYQINYHAVKKVLGPKIDSKPGNLAKGLRTLREFDFGGPIGFDYKTFTGLVKQTLGGHKQHLVHIRNQKKGAVSPQETKSDLV